MRIAFSAYLGRPSAPEQSLLGLAVAAQRAKVILSRVHELLDLEPAVSVPAKAGPTAVPGLE